MPTPEFTEDKPAPEAPAEVEIIERTVGQPLPTEDPLDQVEIDANRAPGVDSPWHASAREKVQAEFGPPPMSEVELRRQEYRRAFNEQIVRQSGLVLRNELGLVRQDVLAACLDLKEQTLELWRMKKKGPPYVKLGKGVFYRIADLDAWIGANSKNTVAPADPDDEIEAEASPSGMDTGVAG